LVLEKIGYVDSGFATSMMSHATALTALTSAGRAEELLGEKMPLLAYPAYMQADDPGDLLAAIKTKDGYMLSGKAKRVANGPVADFAVVAAELDDEGPALFLVSLEDIDPDPIEVLGLRSCPVSDIDLADVTIPESHLLLKGTDKIAELHSSFMSSATSIMIATLKASFDYAIEYGSERYQGGKNIHQHSQLRSMYGMMAVEHGTTRQAWLRTIENETSPKDVIAANVMASEMSVRATTDGVQLLGGYGYTMEYPQERRMRDARQAAELFGSPTRLRLSLMDDLLKDFA
jgi:alkylation response protein AidB-like acyl-CoA dehydrogenase